MRISTRSRYGTRMMLDIALHSTDGPVRIQDVADRQGLSIKYLEKLIRVLKDGGFIKSKRGPKGGHMPAKPLERITVGAVVRILEGDGQLVQCSGDESCCVNEPMCLTRRVWKAAANAMFEKLESITFADLVDEMEQLHMNKDLVPDLFAEMKDDQCDTARSMARTYRHP